MSTAACDPDRTDTSAPVADRVSDLARIKRWQDLGGTWRVLARHGDRVTVSLCRCDAGEEMDRITSTDADLLDHLGDREASDD